jgi:hypothetical protein
MKYFAVLTTKKFKKALSASKTFLKEVIEVCQKDDVLKYFLFVLIVSCVFLMTQHGYCWNPGNFTNSGKDTYDAIRGVLTGPVGGMIGLGLCGWGVYRLVMSQGGGILGGIGPLVGGIVLMKAEDILKVMGWLI